MINKGKETGTPNRGKLSKSLTNKEYKSILYNRIYPVYFDECWTTYPKYRKGFKNPGKYLYKFQVRQYRTWKHNRKTQYKPL